MQNLKNHGDILERNNYEILSQIKNYEVIWSKYIGNDGTAKPVEIFGIGEGRNITRKLIWQWNYSIFRNLLILKKILEENPNAPEDDDVGNKLLMFESQLLQAVFIIYNSIEIFDKICDMLKKEDGEITITKKKEKRDCKCNENQILIQGEYSQKYKDFLNLRHWVTHNVRIVYRLQDGVFSLPDNLTVFAKTNKEGYLWENLESKSKDNFQTIDVFIHSFYEKILSDFKIILKRELDFFEKKRYPTIQQLDDLKVYGGIISGSFSPDWS
ncbi:hypothetical protein VB796_11685 [Arcicella sp. LKC2W]|uniref:hypothetical protein n=1 Tax=Arcicella sp. LKC2W TaxID=2984198 RepID=UPI002B2038AE|nr:hypothetical protein [Arcicella sp. LKC2W]MEA5459708.1 hypothetical protein [Arcicella sp. LKC2W]